MCSLYFISQKIYYFDLQKLTSINKNNFCYNIAKYFLRITLFQGHDVLRDN